MNSIHRNVSMDFWVKGKNKYDFTVCPRSLGPFCIITYYIKWSRQLGQTKLGVPEVTHSQAVVGDGSHFPPSSEL